MALPPQLGGLLADTRDRRVSLLIHNALTETNDAPIPWDITTEQLKNWAASEPQQFLDILDQL